MAVPTGKLNLTLAALLGLAFEYPVAPTFVVNNTMVKIKGAKNSVPPEQKIAFRRHASQAMKACRGNCSEAATMMRKKYPRVKVPRLSRFLRRWDWFSVLRSGDVRDAKRNGRPKVVSVGDARRAAAAFTESEGLEGSRVQYANYTEVMMHQMPVEVNRVC